MKYRFGFVSNSSTASFVCDICDFVVEDDINRPEYRTMAECVNGHTVCIEHIVSEDQRKRRPFPISVSDALLDLSAQQLQDVIDNCLMANSNFKRIILTGKLSGNYKYPRTEKINESYTHGIDIYYPPLDMFGGVLIDSLPEIICPICNGKRIMFSDGIRYLLLKAGYSNFVELEKDLKEKFDSDHHKLCSFIEGTAIW